MRRPDFLKLWVGQAVSQIGSRITREGIPFTAVLLLGATPMQMGILNGGSAAAVLVLGLFAGAWVDRARRRPILIAADIWRALILASIPVLALLNRLTLIHLYVISAVTAVMTVIFNVAYQAYIPSLFDKTLLVRVNSQLAVTESIAEVSGPALTGVLVQLLTAPIAIALDALSFLVSAASLAWIGTEEPPPKPSASPHILREIREGLSACWQYPVLRALILRTATGAFSVGLQSLYLLYAVRDLGLNAALLGLVIAAGGVGNLIGALLAPTLVRRFGLGPTLIGAGILLGVASMIPPLAHGTPAVCALFLIAAQLCDAAWPVTNVCDLTLRQSIVPPALLGRVNSAIHLFFRGVLPAGALVGGALATAIGVRYTMAVGGIGFLASNLFLIFSPIRTTITADK